MTPDTVKHLHAMITSLWPLQSKKFTPQQWESISVGAAKIPLDREQVEAVCSEYFRTAEWFKIPGLLAALKKAGFPASDYRQPVYVDQAHPKPTKEEIDANEYETREWWASQPAEHLQALIDELADWPAIGRTFRNKKAADLASHPFARGCVKALTELPKRDRYAHRHKSTADQWRDADAVTGVDP